MELVGLVGGARRLEAAVPGAAAARGDGAGQTGAGAGGRWWLLGRVQRGASGHDQGAAGLDGRRRARLGPSHAPDAAIRRPH